MKQLERTYFITDKDGNGLGIFSTNDPTIVLNMPEKQKIDITYKKEKRDIESRPELYGKDLKKIKKEKPSK